MSRCEKQLCIPVLLIQFANTYLLQTGLHLREAEDKAGNPKVGKTTGLHSVVLPCTTVTFPYHFSAERTLEEAIVARPASDRGCFCLRYMPGTKPQTSEHISQTTFPS